MKITKVIGYLLIAQVIVSVAFMAMDSIHYNRDNSHRNFLNHQFDEASKVTKELPDDWRQIYLKYEKDARTSMWNYINMRSDSMLLQDKIIFGFLLSSIVAAVLLLRADEKAKAPTTPRDP